VITATRPISVTSVSIYCPASVPTYDSSPTARRRGDLDIIARRKFLTSCQDDVCWQARTIRLRYTSVKGASAGRSRSLPAVSFSGLDGVKSGYLPHQPAEPLQTPPGRRGAHSERVTHASARCGHIRYHPVMPADTPGRRLKVLQDGLHQLGARCETLGGELSTAAAPSFEAASHESRAAL
jgi:hypothetical protein